MPTSIFMRLWIRCGPIWIPLPRNAPVSRVRSARRHAQPDGNVVRTRTAGVRESRKDDVRAIFLMWYERECTAPTGLSCLHVGGRGHFDPIAPAALRTIEGRVCSTYEGLRLLYNTTGGHPSAESHRYSGFGQNNGILPDRLQQPFRNSSRSNRITIGQHQEELFPTIATDAIVGSYGVPHTAGCLAQYGVTREVSIGVIDMLEVIEVGTYHTDRRISIHAITLRAIQLMLEQFQHSGTGAQLG